MRNWYIPIAWYEDIPGDPVTFFQHQKIVLESHNELCNSFAVRIQNTSRYEACAEAGATAASAAGPFLKVRISSNTDIIIHIRGNAVPLIEQIIGFQLCRWIVYCMFNEWQYIQFVLLLQDEFLCCYENKRCVSLFSFLAFKFLCISNSVLRKLCCSK